MATALQTLIDAYIKRNANQEITGPVLNGVLSAIADALNTPFIGQDDGDWYEYDPETGEFVNSGVHAQGESGVVAANAAVGIGPDPSALPSVDVIYDATLRQLDFTFYDIQGPQGPQGTPGITGASVSVDANVGTPSVDASIVNSILTLAFHNLKGASAGFGTPTITVGANQGTPSASVTASGPDTAKVFAFAFDGLKGETGPQGPQGPQGNPGSSVDYPFTLANNLTTDDSTVALTAAMGVQLEGEVGQLSQEVDNNADNIVNLQQEIDAIQPIVIEGDVTNAPDQEDITTDSNNLLKFADRPTAVNQMGYKILRKGATFASQVTDTNTIYEIRYDFDLGGDEVTIPSGCILKFNGGTISNGSVYGNPTINEEGIQYVDLSVFPEGVNIKENYLVASKIGMIKENRGKAAHNGSVLDKVLQLKKNLYIDGYYYFNGDHSFDYHLVIDGVGTIDTTTQNAGPTSTVVFLVPNSGASIVVRNIGLVGNYAYGCSFVQNNSCNFLIDHIVFENCRVIDERPCTIDFVDYDAAQHEWGVNKVIFQNNVLEHPYVGFSVNNCCIYEICLVKGNTFMQVNSVCFSHAKTNGFVYGNSNMTHECPIIIDGNVVDNSGFVSDITSYLCLALVESYYCAYTNNKFNNVLAVSSGGVPSLSDCYLSCVQVYYANNNIINMCLVDTTLANSNARPTCVMGFSKNIPSDASIDNNQSLRIFRNNYVSNDYNVIKDMFGSAISGVSDSLFIQNCYLIFPNVNDLCYHHEFIGNMIFTNGEVGYFSNKSVKRYVCGNEIVCQNLATSNHYIVFFEDTSAERPNCLYYEFSNNRYQIGNSANVNFTISAANNYDNLELIIKGNEFSSKLVNGITGNVKKLVFDGQHFGASSSNFPTDTKIVSKTEDADLTNIGNASFAFIRRKLATSTAYSTIYMWWAESQTTDFFAKVRISYECTSFDKEFLLKVDPTNKKYFCYDKFGNLLVTNDDGESGNQRYIVFSTTETIYLTTDTYRRLSLTFANRNHAPDYVNVEITPMDALNVLTTPANYKILVGTTKWDYTRNKLVVWNGTTWVNTDGTAL